MVCDAQSLLDSNPCLSALNPWQLKVVIAMQICGIKNFLDSGEPITCDIQELLDDAECFNGLTEFQLDVIISQLLCDVSGLL